MVNEIGSFKGTVPAEARPNVVVINSDGKWSMVKDERIPVTAVECEVIDKRAGAAPALHLALGDLVLDLAK